MKIYYVSHPYTGNEVENVEDAMKVTNRLAQATGGAYLFINPLAVFGDMGETLTYDQILDQCLELLDRCDGVIFCNGWTRSRGCQAEMDKALQANKAIWFGPEHFIAKEEENVEDAANKKPRETGQILRLSIFYGIAR